jgi:hypothetical protein
MVLPYIKNITHKENISTTFRTNRHLLYLDQFINFVEITHDKLRHSINTGLTTYINHYFVLPIVKEILSETPTFNDTAYSNKIYERMNILYNKYYKKRDITDMAIFTCHGGIGNQIDFSIVPENVIIAFTTPFNKFLFTDDTISKRIFEMFKKVASDSAQFQNFLNNPACFLRGDSCMKHTVYYYPGQLIPNIYLSFDMENETDKKEDIIYIIRDSKTYSRKQIFKEKDNTKIYEIKISDLLLKIKDDTQSFLKNKLIYINCCRSAQDELYDRYIEFLYRYETIISHLNMSYCNTINNNIGTNIGNSCHDYTFKKISLNLTKKENSKEKDNIPFFYDPLLSSKFNESGETIKLHMYQDLTKLGTVITVLNNLKGSAVVHKFAELFIHISKTTSTNKGDLLVELFTKVNKNNDELVNYFIENNILAILYEYKTSGKLNETQYKKIFENVITIYKEKYSEKFSNVQYINENFINYIIQYIDSNQKNGEAPTMLGIISLLKLLKNNIKFNNFSTFINKIDMTHNLKDLVKKNNILYLFDMKNMYIIYKTDTNFNEIFDAFFDKIVTAYNAQDTYEYNISNPFIDYIINKNNFSNIKNHLIPILTKMIIQNEHNKSDNYLVKILHFVCDNYKDTSTTTEICETLRNYAIFMYIYVYYFKNNLHKVDNIVVKLCNFFNQNKIYIGNITGITDVKEYINTFNKNEHVKKLYNVYIKRSYFIIVPLIVALEKHETITDNINIISLLFENIKFDTYKKTTYINIIYVLFYILLNHPIIKNNSNIKEKICEIIINIIDISDINLYINFDRSLYIYLCKIVGHTNKQVDINYNITPNLKLDEKIKECIDKYIEKFDKDVKDKHSDRPVILSTTNMDEVYEILFK